MATTTTTNYGIPIPPLAATGTADGYGTLMAAADTAIKAAIDAKMAVKVLATTASSATPTPAVGTAGADIVYTVTALGEAAAFGAPTGTPTQGQRLTIRIKDDGTGRALTWNAVYVPIGVVLPATTIASKLLYISAIYNSTASKWDVLGVSQEA